MDLTGCYHIQKDYHGAIKCHDIIKSAVHKLSDALGKQIALSLLTNHFIPTILISPSAWSLSIRDFTPFMDTVAHHDARIPHLFLSEGPMNPHAMKCNATLLFCWKKGRTASSRARRGNSVCSRPSPPYCEHMGEGAEQRLTMELDDAQRDMLGAHDSKTIDVA